MPDQVRAHGILLAPFTRHDHKTSWRRQKEKTASTSTELGFPDHIAATDNPTLSELDFLLRLIPYQTGYSPQAFSDIHDFQILKKSNVYILQKMRIITLFTAAFNMNNKLLGRDSMRNAELLNLLPHEQAGSRKGRRAIYSIPPWKKC